ncbi:hypothetical protein ABIA40_004552 [Bradyrhizobium sp. USDA 223]
MGAVAPVTDNPEQNEGHAARAVGLFEVWHECCLKWLQKNKQL